jgi:hypothetical protein
MGMRQIRQKSKIIEVAFENMRCRKSAEGLRNSILCDGVWQSEIGLRINNRGKIMASCRKIFFENKYRRFIRFNGLTGRNHNQAKSLAFCDILLTPTTNWPVVGIFGLISVIVYIMHNFI